MSELKGHPNVQIELDQGIVSAVEQEPGVAVAEVVKALLGRWSMAYIRQRVDFLAARGEIRMERRYGRLFLYPVEV